MENQNYIIFTIDLGGYMNYKLSTQHHELGFRKVDDDITRNNSIELPLVNFEELLDKLEDEVYDDIRNQSTDIAFSSLIFRVSEIKGLDKLSSKINSIIFKTNKYGLIYDKSKPMDIYLSTIEKFNKEAYSPENKQMLIKAAFLPSVEQSKEILRQLVIKIIDIVNEAFDKLLTVNDYDEELCKRLFENEIMEKNHKLAFERATKF